MMAQSDRTAERAANEAKDVAGKAGEQTKRTVDRAAEVGREAMDRAEAGLHRGLHVVGRAAESAAELQREMAQRSAEGTTELGRAVADLWQEQARDHVKAWAALADTVDWNQVIKAVDWDQVAQIQSEYLRLSLERTSRFARHYLEISQSVMTAVTSAARDETRKAA
jgi:hypothetical protein